ncbi:hypothetical protein, partial [Rubrivivax albus]|uniref:hypothetical protein n=1 Tax=Rubrivivax albus TaxID=2499835 RepID=UPI0013053857
PVVTSPHLPLGVFVGVHLASLVDTIVAVADALLKMGSPDAYDPAVDRGSGDQEQLIQSQAPADLLRAPPIEQLGVHERYLIIS